MRLSRPAASLLTIAATPVLTGVVVALPVTTHPQPSPHSVAPAVRDIRVTTGNAVATSSFSVVGASWSPGSLASKGTVEVRVHGVRGWSRWTTLAKPDGGPDPNTADARRAALVTDGTVVSEPVWVGTADGVESRVVGVAGPAEVPLTLVDPGSSAADANSDASAPAGSAYASINQPYIRTRADWGADESLRKHACPDGPDYNRTIKVGFIHHTDTGNDYSRADVPRIIRGIYAYHVQGNGWCDIGYNYVVDKFGRIWEGRYGGIDRAVVGAHTGGFNTDSFGASMLGTFTSHEPTSAMISATERLFAWKLGRYYRNPSGYATLISAGGGTDKFAPGVHVRFHVISGHRDAGNTTCPGNDMYSKLPRIRRAVLALDGASFLSPSITPRTDTTLGAGDIAVRAGALTSMSWTLTVANKNTGKVVLTRHGTATPDAPVATGWNRTTSLGLPAPPGQYVLTLSGGTSSSTARPFARTVTLTSPVPAHPAADVYGNGFSALVVGAPGRTVDGASAGGAVVTEPATRTGLADTGGLVLTENTPGVPGGAEPADRFGAAVVAGDFDRDGFADVAVGVPGEGLGSAANAGAVVVLPGSPDGPRGYGSRMITEATGGIPDAVATGNRFGAALATGDVNGDGYPDLVVGAPGVAVNGFAGAGSITVIPGSATGLDPAHARRVTEASSGVPLAAATGDGFGAALAVGDLTNDGVFDVAVGAPGKTATDGSASGSVTLLPGGTSGPAGLGSSAVLGSDVADAGGFGSALAVGRFAGRAAAASLAVTGAEGVAILSDATGVLAAAGTVWNADSPGVPGRSAPGDGFGASLAVGDLDSDGFADLVVGVPRRTIGTATVAGSALFLFGSASGLTADRAVGFNEGTSGVPGTVGTNNAFATSLAVLALGGGRPRVAIGVPGQSYGKFIGQGAVVVVRGGSAGLVTTGALIRRFGDATGVAAGPSDAFGAALGKP